MNQTEPTVPVLARVSSVIVVLGLSICVVAGASAQECGFVSSATLDEVLPDQAPWRTISGGVGACQFMSSGLPQMISFTQMVKASSAEAEDYIDNLRKGVAESYEVTDLTEIGEHGFYYRPGTDIEPSGRSLFFAGHRDRVVVMSSMSFQEALSAEEIAGVVPLIESALAIATDEKALEAATSCPWFESSVLEKLFGGEPYEENVFGENSCMAYVGSKILLVKMIDADDPERLLEAMSDASCEQEPLSAFGVGSVEYGCTSGNPRAMVRQTVPGGVIDFSYAPGTEPTEEDRSHLIDLARLAALALESP